MNYILLFFLNLFSIAIPIIAQNSSKLILNPSSFTPLSAVYRLDNTNQIPLTIIVRGKSESSSIGVRYPAGYGTDFPVYGLYENFSNTIVIRHGNQRVRTFNVITPKIKFYIKSKKNEEMTITTKVVVDQLPKSSIFTQELFFTSLPNNSEIIGFDREGEIRYIYQNTNMKPWLIRMGYDKNKIYFNAINDHKEYYEMDLLGKVYVKEKMPVHHETVTYKDNNSFMLGNSRWGWEDMIFIVGKDKKIVDKISIGDIIRKATSPEDHSLLNKVIYDEKNIYTTNNRAVRVDWAHANSLVYDKKNDRLYISLRHLGILAVRVNTWSLEWFFVDDTLKISEGLKYAKKPKESIYLKDIPSLTSYKMSIENKYTPRGQHSLFLRKNGNLMLFDNQSKGRGNSNGSRLIEYAFDHLSKKARVTRVFYDNKKTYSRYVGDVDLTGQNHQNTLIFYGHGKPRRIIEIGPKNNIIYQLDVDMYTMAYRIDKFPLYPYRDINKKYNLDYIEE